MSIVSGVRRSGVAVLQDVPNSKGWKLTVVDSVGSPPMKLLLNGLVSESDEDSLGGLKIFPRREDIVSVSVVSLRSRGENSIATFVLRLQKINNNLRQSFFPWIVYSELQRVLVLTSLSLEV